MEDLVFFFFFKLLAYLVGIIKLTSKLSFYILYCLEYSQTKMSLNKNIKKIIVGIKNQ